MAITFVAAASAGNDGVSSASVVVSKPTGVVDGDVMLATYTSNNNFWNIPSGWTALEGTTTAGITGNTFRSGLAWKLASSEGSNYTFTKDVGSPDSAPQHVSIMAFRGCDTSSPIQDSTTEGMGSVSASADPNETLTVAQNAAPGLLIQWRAVREASAGSTVPTFSESSGGWDEGLDSGQLSSTGNTAYAVGAAYTGEFLSTDGARGGPTGGIVCNSTTTDNVFFMVALLGVAVSTNAPATVASATATAYAPASFTVSTTSAFSAITATAHNATVLTGVAAEDVDHASITATAYDAAGWVIHPVDVGAIAFDATVAIGTQATHAAVSASVSGATGYYGAPASRRWTIAAESRTWTIESESRVWTIPSED